MAPFLLITDLDNTLVGDPATLGTLNEHLEQHRQTHGTRIVYATGRSRPLYDQLQTEANLLTPDVLILSVGTVIYYQGQAEPDPTWSARLAQGWDPQKVRAIAAQFPDLQSQPDIEQGTFKASYHLAPGAATRVLPELEAKLAAAGLDVRLIYSSSVDLDILPRQGNKGTATDFVRQHLGLVGDRTVVSGDSGNDIPLFESSAAYGVIVGNARPELLAWHTANPSPQRHLAQAPCAGGILEGLMTFGFLGDRP